jgi:hypothetical protein
MRRLERIEQRLCRVQQRMRKSQMRGDIQRFHETGQLPQSEPAASFVNLLSSFDKMIDVSVGGPLADYDQAREAYEAAVKRWERTERGIEWTA